MIKALKIVTKTKEDKMRIAEQMHEKHLKNSLLVYGIKWNNQDIKPFGLTQKATDLVNKK